LISTHTGLLRRNARLRASVDSSGEASRRGCFSSPRRSSPLAVSPDATFSSQRAAVNATSGAANGRSEAASRARREERKSATVVRKQREKAGRRWSENGRLLTRRCHVLEYQQYAMFLALQHRLQGLGKFRRSVPRDRRPDQRFERINRLCRRQRLEITSRGRASRPHVSFR
jgi:hypothetical protein